MKVRFFGDCAKNSASVLINLRWLGMFVLALGVLLLPLAADQDSGWLNGSSAYAGKGPGKGGDGSGGGDGGGNAGSGKGGSKGGNKSDKGDLYGDMIYIERDVNGVPVVDAEGCHNPIAWDGESWIDLPLYHEVGYDPILQDEEEMVPDFCEIGEGDLEVWGNAYRVRVQSKGGSKSVFGIGDQDRVRDRIRDLLSIHRANIHGHAFGPSSSLEDTDGELGTCDIITLCADNSQEVDLGRLSVLRAPARVMDKARDEVIKVLDKSTGPNSVTLDPSGRLTVDGTTFDSPLVNLGLYREFHRFWQLQDTADPPVAYFIPGSNAGLFNANFDPNYGAYLAMAFGLGSGSDKYGSGVDVDVVSRINAILHLPGDEYLANDPGGFPPTWSEQIETKWHYFINYSDFDYQRDLVWTGCIMYDYFDEGTQNWVMNHPMEIIDIFYLDDPDGLEPETDETVSNIAGFALAANDARRVLAFVHDIGDDQLRGRVDNVFERTETWCPSP